jgi:hypothetical protein
MRLYVPLLIAAAAVAWFFILKDPAERLWGRLRDVLKTRKAASSRKRDGG